MPPPSHRKEKLNHSLAREISRIICFELNDPRMGFATVTRVSVSPDFRQATVFVSALGTEGERSRILHGLSHASGFIHRSLRDRIEGLKYIPQLYFKHDPSVEGAVRMEKLIDEAGKGSKGKFISELPKVGGDSDDAEDEAKS